MHLPFWLTTALLYQGNHARKTTSMYLFTAWPSPLRHVMGWRARQLNRVFEQLAREEPDDFQYQSYWAITDISLLASNGYHPNERGYKAIAESLVAEILCWSCNYYEGIQTGYRPFARPPFSH
ncbi:MAG: hypothetical protein KA296_17515 [Marinobacter sp.]|nr:hypothetical protein [Marinobacter sp.]